MSYITTYKANYGKKEMIKSYPARENLEEFDELPEGAVYVNTKIMVKGEGLETSLRKIQEMYRNRMKSVYMVSYDGKTSFDEKPTDMAETKSTDDVREHTSKDPHKDLEITDQMLETCKVLKSTKMNIPILPPLVGSRKLFGYMNPKYFHTGKTAYQEEIADNGCMLLFGANLNKSRGFLEEG